MNVKKLSADFTSTKNTYIVLRRNSFRYYGTPTFPVPLNKNFTPPYERNYCQRISLRYCGPPYITGSFKPKFHIPFWE